MFQEWLLVRRRQWLLFCPLLGTSPPLTLQSVEPRPFFQVLCTVKRPTLYCLLALLALLTPLCFGQLKSCYYDVGSPANDFPCDPAANVSICCGGSYYCAEDFYCIIRVGSWGVGSCTDKRWQDPACPLPLGSSCVPARHALAQVSV